MGLAENPQKGDTECVKVVIVEDMASDAKLSLRSFKKCGIPCDVTVLSDGNMALEHLLDPLAAIPDLIVLDFNLPYHNGLEILLCLRSHAHTQFVPIVIFSGTNQEETLQACYSAGANSCVTKPDDPGDYVGRLGLAASYWLTVNQCTHAPTRPSRRNGELTDGRQRAADPGGGGARC